MNIRKKALVGFLSVFVLLITLVSFLNLSFLSAYSSNEIVIQAGASIEVENVVKADDNNKLVPLGAILGIDDVDKIEVTYEVKLNNTDKDLKLNVTVDEILIGGESEYAHLVNIKLVYDDNISSEVSYVNVVITLNMPSNKNEYLSIMNQQITYKLTFQAYN